ncbi:tetratricopeptide repeat protein [Blastomonas sp. AAP53]|uniref:tetratricopeptide repeat protein n=1 Tax=Blastomonas sp. AAP53 TaxID=1248760 RepID=UPI0012676521|nr:tetratricopeptide repeat protein [Blastomonas sp. AAP53]
MTSRAENTPGLARRLMLALVAGALLLGGPASRLQAEDTGAAREAMARAEAHRARGDNRAARIELMNAIKAAPRLPAARMMQARVFLSLFDAAGAEGELAQALELGADRSLVRAPMAEALLLQGRAEAALAWLGEGPVPAPDAGYAARTLGRAQLALGAMDAARAAFDRALEFSPDDSLLWTDIARFRIASGDQAGGMEAADHAVALNPSNVRALQLRGELTRNQTGLGAALPWFERALALDPNDVSVLGEYAATLGDMGRMRAMLMAARQIVALQPDNPRGYFLQAVLAARAGKYSLARTLIQKTGGALERVPAAMQVEGVVEFQLGNYRQAIDRFERLADAQPHNRRAAELLARALYAEGEHETLLERFRPQADHAGSSAYILTLVARSLEAMGEGNAALEYLARAAVPDTTPLQRLDEGDEPWLLAEAARTAPRDARAVIPYVRMLVARGDFPLAAEFAKPLADGNPGVPDAQILLGDVYLASGNAAGALPLYQRAAQIRLAEPVVRRLSLALRETGRGAEADALLHSFVDYSPANTGGLRLLANAYIDRANWPGAVAALTALHAQLGSNQPVLLTDLALARLRAGDPGMAAHDSRLAYRIQPASPLAAHVRGMALTAQSDRPMLAVEMLEKAQALQPRNPWLRFHLAQAYAAAGKTSRAMGALRASLSLGAFPERTQAAAMLRDLQGSS